VNVLKMDFWVKLIKSYLFNVKNWKKMQKKIDFGKIKFGTFKFLNLKYKKLRKHFKFFQLILTTATTSARPQIRMN